MAGFLIALLSGALMSIQGVFNTQVTKTTGVWVSNGWVQLSAFLVCLGMVCNGQRQCTGFDESGAKVYAAGRCDRRRHHLVCDPEYEYAGAGQGGASDRDRATDRGISDRIVRNVWSRTGSLGMEKGRRSGTGTDRNRYFSVGINEKQ